jgi:hypothetical protein
MNIKEKLFNFVKSIFVNDSELTTECNCNNCKCNKSEITSNYIKSKSIITHIPEYYTNLYDFLFNDFKSFNDATRMIAAHFSSIELMEKLKTESGELEFSPEVSIENSEMDIVLICILGHQSDEEKVKFLKYLKDTYHISFDKEFQKEFGYLYWAYILRLKKTFKFLLENGASRIVKRYEYEPDENKSTFIKSSYYDILELIEPTEKYFIKLLENFKFKNKKSSQKETISKSTSKPKSISKTKIQSKKN